MANQTPPFQRKPVMPGQRIQTQINPADCSPMHCSNCGCLVFAAAVHLHFVSALQSPIGREGIGFTPAGYVCCGCGELNTQVKKEENHDVTRHFPQAPDGTRDITRPTGSPSQDYKGTPEAGEPGVGQPSPLFDARGSGTVETPGEDTPDPGDDAKATGSNIPVPKSDSDGDTPGDGETKSGDGK